MHGVDGAFAMRMRCTALAMMLPSVPWKCVGLALPISVDKSCAMPKGLHQGVGVWRHALVIRGTSPWGWADSLEGPYYCHRGTLLRLHVLHHAPRGSLGLQIHVISSYCTFSDHCRNLWDTKRPLYI